MSIKMVDVFTKENIHVQFKCTEKDGKLIIEIIDNPLHKESKVLSLETSSLECVDKITILNKTSRSINYKKILEGENAIIILS